MEFEKHSIGAQGIINARDLGGFVMPDGSVVKNGLLLRGAALNRATDDDLSLLNDRYDVRFVFDFRNEMEISHAPDRPLQNARYIWLPTLDPESGKEVDSLFATMKGMPLHDFILKHAFNPILQNAATEMYTSMVVNEYTQLQYAVFLQKVVETTEGSIYWHCSQGKDRTGIGAAFILAALGADRDTIVADYDISNEVYVQDVAKLSEEIIALGGGEDELNVVKAFVGVNSANFVRALDLIDSEYGSMDSYLHNELALSDDDIRKMRDRYLTR